MSALAFELPERLEAREPPERRGLERDEVRLMVASRATDAIGHRRFADLDDVLLPGDVIVVNRSATLAAAVPARRPDGQAVQVHFSTPMPPARSRALPCGCHEPDQLWIVELRSESGATPVRHARSGELVALSGGGTLELCAAYLSSTRLWAARLGADVPAYLAEHGRPIRYGYAAGSWPLADYQTVFAVEPGSAEMPSAARPFSGALVARLAARGVLFAPLVLHTGVSSLERNEAPYPERYRVPAATAALVNGVRERGGRVIAAGTTVVRALETVATRGRIAPGAGWTDVVVTPERGLHAVDGLITGWHDPEASHLHLLEAAAGRKLLERSYREAVAGGYLWHEFGDSHIILP